MIKIAPSLLASDFSKLGEEIKKVEVAGADYIHIDVMDGHFVPNITMGSPIVKALRKTTALPFDVHLMVEQPALLLDSFIEAGADIITVHVEADHHLHRSIQQIKKQGIKAAVALNPSTPLSSLECILEDVDMVLIMTVNPGFGGQKFIESMIKKVTCLREMIEKRGLHTDIEVDGGIDLMNIHPITESGANIIVAGSTIFHAKDTAHIIKALKEKCWIGDRI